MRTHYKKETNLNLNQVFFTAQDAGECSRACGALATKRHLNLCHAWVFSRTPGKQDSDGQCRLLTKPTREQEKDKYYAYGVTWPINVAGSMMGIMSNEPLKVGGEGVRWLWLAVLRPAGGSEPPAARRTLHRVPACGQNVHHRRGPSG